MKLYIIFVAAMTIFTPAVAQPVSPSGPDADGTVPFAQDYMAALRKLEELAHPPRPVILDNGSAVVAYSASRNEFIVNGTQFSENDNTEVIRSLSYIRRNVYVALPPGDWKSLDVDSYIDLANKIKKGQESLFGRIKFW